MTGAFLLLVEFVSKVAPEIIKAFWTEHPDLKPPPREGTRDAIDAEAEAAERAKFDGPPDSG